MGLTVDIQLTVLSCSHAEVERYIEAIEDSDICPDMQSLIIDLLEKAHKQISEMQDMGWLPL